MKTAAIIPARYASTRLPGKPLLDINNKLLIQRVWDNVKESNLIQTVIIATDDQKIFDAVTSFGATAIMTSPYINSGTDRIAAALKELNLDFDVVVNVQGDEPFLKADDIDKLLEQFFSSDAGVGTLIQKIENSEDIHNPNVIKVVLDNNRNALYFSRSPLPFLRDVPLPNWISKNTFYKHIGIYAYKKEALELFTQLLPSNLELLEKLEQLRLLQAGIKYFCVETSSKLLGVDTPEDLERARALIL